MRRDLVPLTLPLLRGCLSSAAWVLQLAFLFLQHREGNGEAATLFSYFYIGNRKKDTKVKTKLLDPLRNITANVKAASLAPLCKGSCHRR